MGTSVCSLLSVTSHSWLIENKVDQCVWAEVMTGLLIRKDGYCEQHICVLTECNNQWEHSSCVVYQVRLCVTYTSSLLSLSSWYENGEFVPFNIKRLFTHIPAHICVLLFIILSHCESLAPIIRLHSVSRAERHACLLLLLIGHFTCLHSSACVYIPMLSNHQCEYDWVENCLYSRFWL